MADGMTAGPGSDRIVVRGLRLFAHVGVLEHERELGQWFELDFELGWDLREAAAEDDLSKTLDYSSAILLIQNQTRSVRLGTMEGWSEEIKDLLFSVYGEVPLCLRLRKCSPPISGFTGITEIRRSWNATD